MNLKLHLLFIVTISFFSCENDVHKVAALHSKGLGIEEGKNVTSLMSQGGKIRAKLTAAQMLRYQLDTPKIEFPKHLHVLFYDSLALVESVLHAKYGSYKENQNLIFLRDSVVVYNVQRDTLWCKELYWDQNKAIFYTDKPIRIVKQTPKQVIYGLGLKADQNFKWFTINKIGRIFTGHENYISVPGMEL
jgi:LPS export ABC transporter protein LptC